MGAENPSSVYTALGLGLGFVLLVAFVRRSRQDGCKIHGPKSPSWLLGNLAQLLFGPFGEHTFVWQKEYGSLYRVKGCMGEDRLVTSDYAALKYIFSYPDKFFRSPQQRQLSSLLAGDHGIFVVDRGDHDRIRSVLNSAFSLSQLRNLIPVIKDVALRTAEQVESICASDVSNGIVVNIYRILQDATVDSIGEAVAGQPLNALSAENNELAHSFHNVIALTFSASKDFLLLDKVLPFIPRSILQALLYLPSQLSRSLLKFRHLSNEYALKLVRRNQDEVRRLGFGESEVSDSFRVVVRQNEGIQGKAKLSTAEIAAQVPSILAAGSDTTGISLAWALLELGKKPEWQAKVRGELVEAYEKASGQMSLADLDALVYLDAHLKEVLRIYPGFPVAERMAMQDTMLPLSESTRLVNGKEVKEVLVRKGQIVHCDMASFNRSTIWGPDADVFDPSRWYENRVGQTKTLGPYGNILSFAAGPLACIGWRLSILELQIILIELLLKFEFEAVEEGVRPWVTPTLLPLSETGNPHLPLRVRVLQ